MPQGRRKTPFSGKAKKQQLQSKKKIKQAAPHTHFKTSSDDIEDVTRELDVVKVNQQPTRSQGRSNPNRYALQFYRDSPEELKRRKEEAYKSLQFRTEEDLEIKADEYFPSTLDFPTRPPWNFSMTKVQLEAREHKYFTEYVSEILGKFEQKELSYFELNIETWRQLWRVLEMSEIILVIVDIRFAPLMFPPSLFQYVNGKLHKDMILVLNKVDLTPAPLVVAWKHYFEEKYPNLKVLTFTSFPSYNLHGNQSKSGLNSRKSRGRLRMAAEGAQKLMECCEEIVDGKVDLSSWRKKISEEMKLEYDESVEIGELTELTKVDTSFVEEEKYKGGVLTIGCIGQPNVGKSSLMNALMGKKVVSVSKTPGHTKHFQTIYLTSSVRLSDCPGLVFPSKVPKNVQVLMGSYPIAQLQEPYSSIRFLAERLNIIKMLKLIHVDGEDNEWSPMDICDAWAKRRNFVLARSGRLDSYRAANHLLRMAVEGKICLSLRPPGYTKELDKWSKHPEVQIVEWMQAKGEEERAAGSSEIYHEEEIEDSEEEIQDSEEQEKDSSSSNSSQSSENEEEIESSNKFALLG